MKTTEMEKENMLAGFDVLSKKVEITQFEKAIREVKIQQKSLEEKKGLKEERRKEFQNFCKQHYRMKIKRMESGF